MSAVISRPFVEQRTRNREAWKRLVNDPALAEVREVWACDRDGQMSFSGPHGPLERSALCPDYPREILAKFLR